jgi:hypothetical protein
MYGLGKAETEKRLGQFETADVRRNHGELKGKCHGRNTRKGLNPGQTETIKAYSPIDSVVPHIPFSSPSKLGSQARSVSF